jgi:hypothetical protein
MLKSEKRLKELAIKLNEIDNNIISSAIISLRNEDPFRGAINLLAEVFDRTDDNEIKGLIRNFMNDIKESAARDEVITEIKKPYKPETISMMVSSCWQSGLDYSGYAPDMVRLFLTGDYIISLECLTVIEESAHSISRKMKNELIKYLEDNKGLAANEKMTLLKELISILS